MSTTATYGVYLRVRVHPEKREEFIQLVTELAANVKANEPDALIYEFLQAEDPNEFVFFECFTDEAAFERHQQMDYHVAMSDAGWACLSEDPHIEPLQCITARA
jgi:quinol monooxygenase YgiN